MTTPGEVKEVLGRMPAGVSVVTVDAGGQRIGLTVATLVSLSLDPPLVGVAISRQAAIHELLREAGTCSFSLLTGDQRELADHFARGVPPIAMWEGIAVRDHPGAPLLEGALGWLVCAVRDSFETGTHTFFVTEVLSAEPGVDALPIVRRKGAYVVP